jgi:hypothetical protein
MTKTYSTARAVSATDLPVEALRLFAWATRSRERNLLSRPVRIIAARFGLTPAMRMRRSQAELPDADINISASKPDAA